MAQITLSIPDAVAARVVNAVCAVYGYQVVDETGTLNPQSKVQFVKSVLAQVVKNAVKAHEASRAASLAREEAERQVEEEVQLE